MIPMGPMKRFLPCLAILGIVVGCGADNAPTTPATVAAAAPSSPQSARISSSPPAPSVGNQNPFEGSVPFGVNNALASSRDNTDVYLRDLGVEWISDHLARRGMEKVKNGEVKYDFSEADAKMNEYARQARTRLWFIINIESKYPFEDGRRIGAGKKSAGKYIPDGPSSYRAYGDYLRELVRRVNGAAPGRRVELWSIDNEQASLYVPAFCPSGLTPECGGRAAEAYAEALLFSARVIHEIDSQARIVFGGPGGGTPEKEYDFFYAPALKSLASRVPGGGFDFFDYHNFNVYRDYETNPAGKGLDFFQKMLADAGLPGKPIIIKAGATHSGVDRIAGNRRLHEPQTEAQQAEYLIKRFVYHIANGVPLILWGDIREDEAEHGTYSHNGLMYNGAPRSGRCDRRSEDPCPDPGDGVRKLSYYALKHLIEKLKGSVWSRTETIPSPADDVSIYKFVDARNRPTWMVWRDYWKSGPAAGAVSLEVGPIASVRITDALPREITGAEIVPERYRDSFPRLTISVSGGKVSIPLGASPVFVQSSGTGPADAPSH